MIKTIFCFISGVIFLSGCSISYYIKPGLKDYHPEPDTSLIDFRILLIGDAGEPSLDYREPVLDAMEKQAMIIPEKTLNIFLGDNIYPFGLEPGNDPSYHTTKRRLDEQILVMKNSNTKGIFIPGNHDWGDGSLDGWERILRMGGYIDQNLPSIQMLPKNGCPGPVALNFGNELQVIFIDSQWWLHIDHKPDSTNSNCYPITKQDIIYSLDSLIKNSNGRKTLIAAHHPLITYGPHGGFFDWRTHIFPLLDFNRYLWIPLPVIGSLYVLSRIAGLSPQDISNSLYQEYIERVERVISKYNNVIYASGHEHSIQVLEGINNNLYLISGYGTEAHTNSLSYGDKTIFSVLYPGFIQLDLLKDKSVRLSVFIIENEKCKEVFSSLYFKEEIINSTE